MLRENYVKAGRRSSLPIHAYIGRNGHGKDLAMVHDTIPTLLLGQPVLSTIRLLDWTAPCRACGQAPCVCGQRDWPDHPLWIPFDSWERLLDFRDGDVLMSEVQGLAAAREHQGMPYQVANALRKFRHYNIRLRWNAPDWMAADAVIRRVTLAVTACQGSMGVPHALPCLECGQPHLGKTKHCSGQGRQRLWKDNRRFTWTTFDRADFEEYQETKTRQDAPKHLKMKPLVKQRYWRPGGLVQSVYDTYDEVISLATSDMAGVCVECGGVRKRKSCSCGDYHPRVGSPALVRARDVARGEARDEAARKAEGRHGEPEPRRQPPVLLP